MLAMPLPFVAEVSLTNEQREPLEKIARAASTPQSLAFRARIVLRAAGPDRSRGVWVTMLGSRGPRLEAEAEHGSHPEQNDPPIA